MTTVRAIGDFSGLQQEQVDDLRRLVRAGDLTRQWYVYIRKSQLGNVDLHGNLLASQEGIKDLLITAGVPRERIQVLEEDSGKSGALSNQYRRDLNTLHEAIGRGEVGTVVVIDVARLCRDKTRKMPAILAARMARHRVAVITMRQRTWIHLPMGDHDARDTFLELAQHAAKERDVIRERTMEGKEISVMAGNYTGGPTPIGWAARAGIGKHAADSGVASKPSLYVYEPHRTIKLEIMRASMLPHITTYPGLRRHLAQHNIVIPAFDATVRREAFSRSCLCKVYWKENGQPRRLRHDEDYLPTTGMLRNILLEPLAIGDRLYGSGRSGKYKVAQHMREAAAMDVPVDTYMRAGKGFVRNQAELAVCRTQEEIALYWTVAKKWSKVDLEQARDTSYAETPANPLQAAGKTPLTRPRGGRITNPWAGKVFCLRHGADADGKSHFTHPMRLLGTQGTWQCGRDYNTQVDAKICCTWGVSNRLGRVLDTRLCISLHTILEQHDAPLLRSLLERQEEVKQVTATIRAQLQQLEAERDRQMMRQEDMERRLAGMPHEFVENQVDLFFAKNVRPVMESLAAKQKELVEAGREEATLTSDQSEAELRSELSNAYSNWNSLPTENKRRIIDLMIKSVGVLVGDGINVRECLIIIAWRNGVNEMLVSWRGWNKDTRPWTPEEDKALCSLWPSSCSYEEIKDALESGRKFSAIRRRAIALGVADGSRSVAWQDMAAASEKSWGDKHPDILYASLSWGIRREHIWVFVPFTEQVDATFKVLKKYASPFPPQDIARGVQILISESSSRSLRDILCLSRFESACHPYSASLAGLRSDEARAAASSQRSIAWADPALPLALSRAQAFLISLRPQAKQPG